MISVSKYMPRRLVGFIGGFITSLGLSYLAGTTWANAMILGALVGITAFATIFFIGRFEARLTQRMNVGPSFAWDVWVNDVKVGVITDAQYAAIQRKAFRDGRLVVAQALNLGRVSLNIAAKVLVAVPLTVFWLLVAVLVFDPEFNKELSALGSTDLIAIVTFFNDLLLLGGFGALVSVFVLYLFGHHFGFRNCYGEAIARMVRQRCGTPSEGEIHLSRVVLNSGVFANHL